MRSSNMIAVTALAAVIACSGCTTMSLERHTANQISSAADHRCRQTLNCLAAVAANPASLPSYCLLSAGNTRITDTASLASTTIWEHLVTTAATTTVRGFASETFGGTVSRSPTEYWTLIPVAEHSQLEAMRCACQWVLYGPEQACSSCPGLLASPEQDPSPGPHFGVQDRLQRLPADWLHVGRWKDVPPGACYTGHHGDTWVWVLPDGLEGLADFTLVLQDIATLDVSSCTLPRIVLTLRSIQPPPVPVPGASDITCVESRVVKPHYEGRVTELLFSKEEKTPAAVKKLLEEYTTAPPGRRTNIGPTGPNASVAGLRSELSAEAIHSPARILPPGPIPQMPSEGPSRTLPRGPIP